MKPLLLSPSFAGTIAGASAAVLLVLSEYLSVPGVVASSAPAQQSAHPDPLLFAAFALCPAVLSSFLATVLISRLPSIVARLLLGLPLALLLGLIWAIPIHWLAYKDIPLDSATVIWVEVPVVYLFTSAPSAALAVAVSSYLAWRQRTRRAHVIHLL